MTSSEKWVQGRYLKACLDEGAENVAVVHAVTMKPAALVSKPGGVLSAREVSGAMSVLRRQFGYAGLADRVGDLHRVVVTDSGQGAAYEVVDQ